MSYATQAELQARLSEPLQLLLADEDGNGAVDTAVIDAALEDASAEIDEAITERYQTPVEPVTPLLRSWCVDLAIERLHLRRREAMSVEIASHAQLVRRALAAIRDGLSGLAGAQPAPQRFDAFNSRLDDDPTFSLDTLDAF